MTTAQVAVIGAGPAGLMAAERLSAAGLAVTIYDRMPTPARKFLMAGRGGLNLTHSEELSRFTQRYGDTSDTLKAALADFPPTALVAWADGLGANTFVGSSGRVFPRAMKASPLLRAWLARLDQQGVVLASGYDWKGFKADGALEFVVAGQPLLVRANAVVLALGGASWPRLGSNGAWVTILARDGIAMTPLSPVNCGVHIPWSPYIRERFSGEPLKRIALTVGDDTRRGEAMITSRGLEGGAIYALSACIRRELASSGSAKLEIDLRPDMTLGQLAQQLSTPRKKQSGATFLRKTAHLRPVCLALLRECGPLPTEPAALAARIKAIVLTVTGTADLTRAISTAGGIKFSEIDAQYMLTKRPGVFVAGEMLDWEGPTGGYLLQATFATGLAAANGALRWLTNLTSSRPPSRSSAL